MGQQPTHEELKQRVAELEAEKTRWNRFEQALEEKEIEHGTTSAL